MKKRKPRANPNYSRRNKYKPVVMAENMKNGLRYFIDASIVSAIIFLGWFPAGIYLFGVEPIKSFQIVSVMALLLLVPFYLMSQKNDGFFLNLRR